MKEKRAKIKISTKLVKRSYVAFALIIAVFALLAYRILTIQTVNFDYYQQKVINQLTTESTIYSRRGVIYDSEGAQLATNISAYRIFIAPSNIRAALSESTGADAKNYDDIIARGLSDILGEKYGVDLPTTNVVYEICYEKSENETGREKALRLLERLFFRG